LLFQVLDLQEQIANVIGINSEVENVSLSDVCQKIPYHKECVIISFTQYYQNDPDVLDETAVNKASATVEADYLDHFLSCIK